MTTSPLAVSPVGDRLKTMLPLLPVAELVYSPTHFPASEARSAESPATVIGVGFDAHAHKTGLARCSGGPGERLQMWTVRRKDDRGSDDRSGPRATACFVDARNELNVLTPQEPLDARVWDRPGGRSNRSGA